MNLICYAANNFNDFLVNSIKNLPAMAFENLNSLETLSIQNNKLTTIPEEVMEPIIDTLRVVDIMGEIACSVYGLEMSVANFTFSVFCSTRIKSFAMLNIAHRIDFSAFVLCFINSKTQVVKFPTLP